MFNFLKKKYVCNNQDDSYIELVWGLNSNIIDCPCSLYTLNDFEITHDKSTGKYYLWIETIYDFIDVQSTKDYIKQIFDRFTEWMVEQGYNTKLELNYSDVFTKGIGFKNPYESIESAYAAFRILKNGFVGGDTY